MEQKQPSQDLFELRGKNKLLARSTLSSSIRPCKKRHAACGGGKGEGRGYMYVVGGWVPGGTVQFLCCSLYCTVYRTYNTESFFNYLNAIVTL